jgi:hypothetical protein
MNNRNQYGKPGTQLPGMHPLMAGRPEEVPLGAPLVYEVLDANGTMIGVFRNYNSANAFKREKKAKEVRGTYETAFNRKYIKD